MASAALLKDLEFHCPVCLDILKAPVTVPCGHHFCKGCIEGCWDQEDQRGIYSCPECRHTFTPRPVLKINSMLSAILENLKMREVHQNTGTTTIIVPVDLDQFHCPVCLDLPTDPVTIACGHTLCMRCIDGCWDQENRRGVYSCPQCRETFTPRSVPHRNHFVARILSNLKTTEGFLFLEKS